MDNVSFVKTEEAISVLGGQRSFLLVQGPVPVLLTLEKKYGRSGAHKAGTSAVDGNERAKARVAKKNGIATQNDASLAYVFNLTNADMQLKL